MGSSCSVLVHLPTRRGAGLFLTKLNHLFRWHVGHGFFCLDGCVGVAGCKHVACLITVHHPTIWVSLDIVADNRQQFVVMDPPLERRRAGVDLLLAVHGKRFRARGKRFIFTTKSGVGERF